MKIKDLISLLEPIAQKEQNAKKKNHFRDAVYGEFSVLDYLKDLKKMDPNSIVSFSNGECEQPGVYAPSKDGKIDFDRAKPVKEGDAFPSDWKEWVRIAYLPIMQVAQRPSL